MQMPEEELSEMLTINENEYENGVYQLLLEAAKSRGLGTEKREIIPLRRWCCEISLPIFFMR